MVKFFLLSHKIKEKPSSLFKIISSIAYQMSYDIVIISTFLQVTQNMKDLVFKVFQLKQESIRIDFTKIQKDIVTYGQTEL